ncbi:N-acetylmuramoyl-L-alanine amidase domain-containing protein SAOUHSC_02979-like [Achroia grisella]|uniref:N-acetylmuramoyl-L-alanine amidase domain-containing protein SAOUHSC_02979-like n=1 Tax=Achroia grisella TaxID=688607 RepID=UPI0027D20581|nr:N-acetylmuramoyl-L-alanine amidase domain-containing protein SAOUHSC_02979-like [Achroia grisella]
MTAREVELSGGAPWGFRMHGGADHNQPLRISRRYSDSIQQFHNVNPGRKASLSGIREGDVISSINGRSTRGMNNADAHAMLRSAGPVLRLGLNEDREMSPRRRSIGKSTELRRPSQLITEFQSGRATPQAPVYATIRPPIISQNRPISSTMGSSLNSIPTALSSTTLVKSVTTNDEPLKFHPTNPFYTTLPSNYTSASKLPLPNNRAYFSGVDRNKTDENISSYNDISTDFKSSTLFNSKNESGPSSFPHENINDLKFTNGYDDSNNKQFLNNDKNGYLNNSATYQYHDESLPNITKGEGSNPFESKRNSDPFEKYLRKENKKYEYKSTLPNSQSETNFQKKEEIRKHTVTEHKISETEEVKTIKKIIFNGSNDHCQDNTDSKYGFSENKDINESKLQHILNKEKVNISNERPFPTTSRQENNYYNNFEKCKQDDSNCTYSSTFEDFYSNSQSVSDSSATETDDSEDSGREKTVSDGQRTKKYSDPKRRTITKVSKKILKAIEKLTCNIKRYKKNKKVFEPTPLKKG